MTVERIGLLAAALLVAGGIAGGFALVGTPSHQRDLALDRTRAGDIDDIARAMMRRYHPDDGHVASVPSALPHDLTQEYTRRAVSTVDPADRRPYGYARLSPTRYRLCTTFALRSDPDADAYRSNTPHPAGAWCYVFDTARTLEPISAGRPAT